MNNALVQFSQYKDKKILLEDFTNLVPGNEFMKAFVKGNNAYIKAAAVVGIQGLLSIALTAVSKFSGRSFRTFKDRQSALEWLIMQ